MQIEVIPYIGVGIGLTVIDLVTKQPVDSAYDIVTVPALTPVTEPVTEPTVATDVLLLVQVPPGVGAVNEIEDATQTFVVPVIGSGNGLTVKDVVAIQPSGSV